jgi:hypothetical protein
MDDEEMLKIIFSGTSRSTMLQLFIVAWIALTSAAYASTNNMRNTSVPGTDYFSPDDLADIGFAPISINANAFLSSAIDNHRYSLGPPSFVPPVNPPIDTPAFYNGLENTPTVIPASVPIDTLPGSGFGRTVVPVPAAVWLFGSGLLLLAGIAIKKKAPENSHRHNRDSIAEFSDQA